MEDLIAQALKNADSPLFVLTLILIAKDFYQSRLSAKDAAENTALTDSLKNIADALAVLCSRVDRIAHDTAVVVGKIGGGS